MRRIVAVFLLMLFSLQSIWVAAAPYCQHEETTGLSHVGHHTHDHHSHAADEPHGFGKDTGSSQDQSSALEHADCHVFHAGCSPLSEVGFNFQKRPSSEQLGIEPEKALPSPLPARPERPKWPSLA
jgi:hypothetical protein